MASNGYFADKIINENFGNKRKSYQNQIDHLKDEIAFLRELVRKNVLVRQILRKPDRLQQPARFCI